MRFKVGDRVRIKSIAWYNENKNNKGIIVCGSESFTHPMSYLCNKVVNIITIQDDCYRILEDGGDWYWTDEMIEGLVEEPPVFTGKEFLLKVANIELPSGTTKIWECPKGYQFVDENDNVINATKIVLEKKKKKYPKTYEECYKIMGVKLSDCYIQGYKSPLLEDLQELLICRDAYWKLYGEEMGLGKPWELSIGTPIYYIYYNRTVGTIKNDYADDIQGNVILAFPTAEMRDAFYENFKELIKQCKELL